jgi:carbon storage regulator
MALYLTRKKGEKIIVNGNITISVESIQGGLVKLSFDFPKGCSVLRKELIDRARENNDESELYLKGLLT